MKKILLMFLSGCIFILHADLTDKITLNGFFNFEFEERIAGARSSQADEYGSFDSDMLNLLLNVQATDNIRVAIDLTWEHGSQSELNKGNVGYEYAFAEYTFSDALKIRAGKMFTPFGIYNEIHDAKPSIMITKEPNPTNKMYFISRNQYEQTTLYPRWGSGIALLGDSDIANIPFDYIVQITNGDLSYGVPENEFDKDDNHHKAITARVRADITDDLQIGASIYHDIMNRYDSNGDPISSMDVDSQGAQLIWHATDNFRLEAEYISGTLNVKGIESFRRDGYSILPSYYISDNVNLYLLYAYGDPNNNTDNDGATNIAPGVNIEIDNNVFLKIDVLHVIYEKQNTYYLKNQQKYNVDGNSYSELRAALSIGF